jgi:predicted MFS family arabinose efflux permease
VSHGRAEESDAEEMDADESRERLLTGYSGRLLVAVSLGWAAIQSGRLVLSPLLPTVMEGLAITDFEAGMALSLMWGLYALCQYPSGRLSDNLTRKTLLVSGLALLVAGFVALASAPNYLLFLFGAAVVGLGAGLYPTPARALVSDLFVKRRGQAFGIHTASGDLGGAAAAGLAVVALAFAGWRSAFMPVIVVLAAVALALYVWGREAFTPPEADREGVVEGLADARATARRLWKNPRMRWLLLAYALFAFTWQSATGFLPTFLRASKGFRPGLASGGFAALFVVGAVVKPLSGSLGDRFARATVAAGALVAAAGALVGLLAASGTLAVGVAVVVFAAGLMAYPPVMQALLMDTFPDGSMGGDLGATRTVYLGLGSLGPSYVGFVAGRVSYAAAFAGLLGCLLVSAAIVVGLARTR